jgi:type III secretory pathway component EscT
VIHSPVLNDELRGIVHGMIARLHCEYGFILIRRAKYSIGIQELLNSVKTNPGIFLLTAMLLFGQKSFRVLSSIAARLRLKLPTKSATEERR